MVAAGGSAFYRAAVLERLFRDIQGRNRRPQERMQHRCSGKPVLGRQPGSWRCETAPSNAMGKASDPWAAWKHL